MTAAPGSDTTILIQLIRQNDLKIKRKFSKSDDSTLNTRTPAQLRRKGSRIAPWGAVPPNSLGGVLYMRPALPRESGAVQCWTPTSFQVYWWRVSHQEVALLVQSQVIRTGKAALAVGALERLNTRVFTEVSCQFIGTSELPCAAFPHALVRFLTWTTEEKMESRPTLSTVYPRQYTTLLQYTININESCTKSKTTNRTKMLIFFFFLKDIGDVVVLTFIVKGENN